MNKHIGSNFDDFLKEEGLLEHADSVAVKRLLAYNLKQKMNKNKLSVQQVAVDLGTSRAAVNRIFDERNTSITLGTIEKVAHYLNRRVRLSLV